MRSRTTVSLVLRKLETLVHLGAAGHMVVPKGAQGWRRWALKARLVRIEPRRGCWHDDATGQQGLPVTPLSSHRLIISPRKSAAQDMYICGPCCLWKKQPYSHSSSSPMGQDFRSWKFQTLAFWVSLTIWGRALLSATHKGKFAEGLWK